MSDLDATPQAVDWPVLLGRMIGAKQQLDELDTEQLEEYTLPRVRVAEDELARFEDRIGERLPAEYREFLRHADGWPKFYFQLDLFGVPELSGGGSWRIANEQLVIYETEAVLSDLSLEAAGVIPIGAGQGMTDLLLIVRNGWPDAGQVSWIDGEEIDRFTDFASFMASMADEKQQQADSLKPGGTTAPSP